MRKALDIWHNMSAPAKASIAFLVSTILLKGIVFLSTPIFTRIMSEYDMGVVGTYQSWRGIFETVAILSMTSAGVFNVGMSKYRDRRETYMSNMVAMCMALSVVAGSLLWFLYDELYIFLQLPKSLIILMALYCFITPAQTFWISKQRYEYKYKAAFLVTVLMSLFGQIVAIVLVYMNESNLGEIRLWGTALVEMPIGAFFAFLLLKRGKSVFDREIWKETLIFAIPLIPHYLSSVVLTASDRIMISMLDSVDAAGIYTVVYGTAAIVSIIWGAIQGSLTPHIYDKLDVDNCDGISSLVEKLIVGYGLLCIFVTLFSPEIMLILGPSSYQIGIYAMPPITGAIFISSLYNIFSMIEFYHRKSVFITIASIISAIVNIVLNYLLIPHFGFIAAGYTTLLSYIVLAMMHYINMKKIEKRPIFNEKKIFILETVILMVILLPIVVYDYPVVRYLFALIIAVMIFRNRNIFLDLLIKKKTVN